MYKLCKTEQSAARQRQLELELLKAMGAHQYEEISVSDLCDQIGIPRKSFYRYFSGKEGALHALIDHTLLEFDTRFSLITARETKVFRKGLEHFFAFWKNQKPLLDALARSGLSGLLMERAVSNAVRNINSSDASLTGEMQDLRSHATMFSVCGLMSMVITWHHEDYPHDPAYMAKIAARLMTNPLFPDNRE